MVAQDLLKTFLAGLSVLVVIIVSRQFVRILDQAISGQVSNETLLSILGLKTIVAIAEFLPVALFLAVLMVLGRMYRDHEMAAVSSAGGGSGVIYRAVFLLVFPVSLLAASMSLLAAPWAEARILKLVIHDEETSETRGIAAGKFSEYSQGDLVFYVETISADKKMHKVFVQSLEHDNTKVSVINAEAARMEDSADGRYIIFEQGERIKGQPGNLDYVIEQFAEYAVRLDTKTAAPRAVNMPAIPSEMLWQHKTKAYIAEFQRRLSIPFGALLLSFIAVPLAQISPRGGVYGNMVVGFLIYFSYGNLTRISQGWVTNGTIPTWFGGIGVDVLLFVIGSLLLARLYSWQWLVLRIKGQVA
ncbi:MAG: LPS export ABC transporter permease LptF [Methylococcales bacterium]|nr:MAG: LPS export ABC transporter permease LptF [Methylococcales bacterium]